MSAVVPLSVVVVRNAVKTLTSFIGSGILHRFTVPSLYFSCGAFEYGWDEKCCENFDQSKRLWYFTQVLLYPHSISAVVPLSIVVMRNVVKTSTSFIESGTTQVLLYP